MFKICGGTSKNKINIAADIAAFIILSAIDARGKLFWTDETARLSFLFGKRSGKKCVLMAEKAAGIDHKTVSVGIESDRLSVCGGIPRGIFDSEMLERYIMCIDKEGISAECTALTAIFHQIQGIIIIADDSVRTAFAHSAKCDIWVYLWLVFHGKCPVRFQ